MSVTVTQITPVIDYAVRGLCVKPYPGHPKGCPNFNKKKGCPPNCARFEDYFDMTQPIYAIVNEFDFKSHTDRMRALRPDWSDRQVECCLYWQPKARKALAEGAIEFLREHKGYTVNATPEAMGLVVTETLMTVGVHLEWPPKLVTYQVAVAGIKKHL